MRTKTAKLFDSYLKVLAVFYALAALLHLLDILNLRLKFSEMDVVWKTWILVLLVFDALAAYGLWERKHWGVVAFLFVATSQLIAYIGFRFYFGDQWFLVTFHIVTVGLYFYFKKQLERNR